MKKTISFRAEPELHSLLNDFVKKSGMKKSKVIEFSIMEYINSRSNLYQTPHEK